MNNVKTLRKAHGYTLKQLADLCEVAESTIQRIESGTRKPSFEVMLKLGEVFNCPASDIFTDKSIEDFSLLDSEKELIRKYNALDEHGRSVVYFVLNAEYQRCTAEVEEVEAPKTKIIPLFPAAAGPGEPMETTAFQEHEVDAESKAQFAVKISGDSMEPELHDGEIVLCARRVPQIGEIAVIMVNGFLYVKQYIADSFGNIYLRSLNRQRKDLDVDIMASGNDTVTGYGVVIHRHVPLVRE